MKKFLLKSLSLILLLFFPSCESPRLVFPDMDFGVVIDSSEVQLFTSGKRDSVELIVMGDRIKSEDSVVVLFSKNNELRFSAVTTMKLFVKNNIDFGSETIVSMTDHYKLTSVNDSLISHRTLTKIIFASEKTQLINWDKK